MKSFKELQEAKANPSLTRTVPAAAGERAFVDKHMHVHDILKAFRDAKCDAAFFNGGGVKEFPRKKNRFGRNEKESIKAYEGVEETGEVLEEGGKKGAKRHIFVNGKYVGTTSWAKTNKEALKNYRNVHPDVHGIAAKVAQEGWIAGAIKHPGALTRKAKAAGESNSEFEQTHKDDSGKTGEEARLAITLKKFHKEDVEVNEISKETLKRFSDSDKYMKNDKSKIDSKDDKGTKVRTYINDLRKKKK